MSTDSPLKDKIILVVDDEPDVLETVAEELDMCLLHKADNYNTAIQYLISYTYDIVILDIMGVNGFELLKTSVERGFPTVMLTAHALTPDALAALTNSLRFIASSFRRVYLGLRRLRRGAIEKSPEVCFAPRLYY